MKSTQYIARLIEFYDDLVVLECLIDREEGIYEVMEFQNSLFDGYELEIGKIFHLSIFEENNQMTIEVSEKLDPETRDFEKMNFSELFSGSKLFGNKLI